LLAVAVYRLTFVARERLDLPAYLGSTLRGAFGRAFRAVACPAPPGERCPVRTECPYHSIFESSPPPGSTALRTHDEIPRPFVIAPEWRPDDAEGSRNIFNPGGEFSFGLSLIGRARDFFPYFVVAFREMDRLGRGRRAVELARIEADDPRGDRRVIYDAAENVVRGAAEPLTLDDCARIAPPPGRFAIEFVTQTRLKHEGGWARAPRFEIVFRRLLGRLSSMARFHCGAPLDLDFKAMIEAARAVRMVRNDTRWVRWERYSSRQDRRMQWDGLVGTAVYDGPAAPFWPYLKFGEHIHVGHAATFGLGKIGIMGAG
jgi:CRISPR/Cas system endoribonuclease Cas6 (RAMP superfamily)